VSAYAAGNIAEPVNPVIEVANELLQLSVRIYGQGSKPYSFLSKETGEICIFF
jgi:hypothetical protein